MKKTAVLIIVFCFALSCQRNMVGTDAKAPISWEAFLESGTRDLVKYPDMGFFSEPPICENLDGSYIIGDRYFRIIFYKLVTLEIRRDKRYKFVIMTRSGDIEKGYAPYHNENLVAHFISEPMMAKNGSPRCNNNILETNISNDSLAVRVRLDDGTNLIKVGPIIKNCPK